MSRVLPPDLGEDPMEDDDHRKTRGPAVPEPMHRFACEGVHGAPAVDVVWTQQDQTAALAEGWYLDERDGMILADEDMPFGLPPGAVNRLVRARASEGSELHIRAMIVDAWGAIAAWEDRYREAIGAVSSFAPASEAAE